MSSAQFPDAPEPETTETISRPAGFGRASVLLASGTLVSRAVGFISAIVLANTIGTQLAASNTFTIANQLPNNIYAIIAGGLLSAILVPQIVRAGVDKDGGEKFISRVITLGVVVFLAITIVATLCGPLLVQLYGSQQAEHSGRGLSSADIALATAFAYWCLPQIFFYALYSLLGEVLNARKIYGPFSWAPAVNNVVAVIGLLVFNLIFGSVDSDSSLGNSAAWTPGMIAVLAGTATLGVAAQGGFLILFWRRLGIRFHPEFRWRGVGLGKVGKAAGWTFAMILITQLAGIVQSKVASSAGDHNPSNTVLKNAWLIMMLPHGIITLPIMTPYFTRMAGHVHRGDLDALRHDFTTSLRSVGVLVSLAGAALIVLAYPFSAVFSRTFAETQGMAIVVIAYLVGLIPSVVLFIIQRTFYALEDTRTPFLFQTFQSVLFVSGAMIAAQLGRADIALGIAIVTTIAGIIQTILAAALLKRRIGHLGTWVVLRSYLVFLLALIPASAVGVGLDVALGAFRGGFAVASIPTAVVSLIIIGTAMAIVYFPALAVLRAPEFTALAQPIYRRLRRGIRKP